MRYLITGGTGTLGKSLVVRLLQQNADKIVVYSRDEYKQSEMAREINDERVVYYLGDVRDLERLKDACEDVDIILHTAALKRMDTVSHNSYEVADVNIRGTNNVCIAGKGKKIVFVSTDKAFKPECIYGASKMVAEGIVLAHKGVVWRFGNFIGSRGSVWEIFEKQKITGVLTLTDPEATRFIMPIEDVCDCVLSDKESGIYFPENLKKVTVGEIAKKIAPEASWKIIGLREGEKLHEEFNSNYSSKKNADPIL